MQTGFYNTNANRAYPFVVNESPATALPHAIVVDAGFRVGPLSRFVAGTHTIYLAGIRRQGSWFYLDFASDAPELYDATLTFARHVANEDYLFEDTDSGRSGLSESSQSDSASSGSCDEPLWSGYLVTGKVAALEALLPTDGSVAYASTDAVIEPALVQVLTEGYVTRLSVANDDRTRVDAAEDCDEVVFGFDTGLVYVAERCLIGEIAFKPGYNCSITQQSADNAITIDGIVGAGAGEPCEVEPLFPGETPPAGSNLLEGGPLCNEILRSINGIGGRQFSILTGTGVTITSVPEENKLVMTVDMSGLALCYDHMSRVSESC